MNETICKAIAEKRVLELRYHGYSRMVEPHIYGEDRKGEQVMRCYQLAGGSESGERAGWKLLKVKEAIVIHLAETRFIERAGYRPNDKVIGKVFCQI